MLDLRNFFKNHFNSSQISDDNLRKFSEDHLQRLTANNIGNQYASLLTDTQVLYNDFNTFLKKEDQTFSQQQGKTLTTDNVISDFVQMVSRKEGAVRSEFGKDSAEYQAFFPNGLLEYHQVSKANAEVLMERMKYAGQLYVAQLGQNFVIIFDTFFNNYITARQQQLQTIAKVGALKSDVEIARGKLTNQLMRNLLIISADFIGYTDRLDDYFDQSIIRRANSKNDGTVVSVSPANSVTNIESQGLTQTTEITFNNLSAVPLRIGMSSDNVSLPANIGLTIAPNATELTTISSLGNANDTFLNVENLSNVHADYEVLLI
jgi:hypothetical protein